MPAAKKKNTRKPTRKKRIPAIVVVTNTIVPADQSLFPEKLEKAKEILSKTKLLPR